MSVWMIEKGQRVEVDRMGVGTVTKITSTGAMVALDVYKIEVEIQRDWMKPIGGNDGSSKELKDPQEVPLSMPSPVDIDPVELLMEPESIPVSDAAKLIITAMGMGSSGQGMRKGGIPVNKPAAVTPPLITADPPAPVTVLPQDPVLSDPVQLRARRALESLRFGLVPFGFIEELTLGYEELKQWSNVCLPESRDGNPGMYKVVGPFGTGKSHTIAVLRHIAEQEGYLTAKVEVDGQTISLSEPSRLLHTLWGSLRGKGLESESPLVYLNKKALETKGIEDQFRRASMTKAANNLDTIERLIQAGALELFEDVIESVISGSDELSTSEVNRRIVREFPALRYFIRLHPPILKSVYYRGANFVEALASTAKLAEAGGYKGLVIFIDEFEVEAGNLTRVRLSKVVDQIRRIGSYMTQGDESQLPETPLSIVFGTVGDESDGTEYEIDKWIRLSNGSSFHLHTWNQEERLVLAGKIYALYQKAYGVEDSFQPELAVALERQLEMDGADDSGLIRRFIKWYVSLLDMKYGPPAMGNK